MPEIQNTPDGIKSEDYGAEVLYSAYETGQIVVQGDTLRIGVGAIRPGEYTDDNGQVQSGTVAHLAFFVRGQPELETDMDVHEGKIITVAGYRIRVTDIDREDGLVVVKIAGPVSP